MKKLSTETSRHALLKQTQFFEATSSGSFQGACIPSVTSRWSCSKTSKPNCCSYETLFREETCEFKRRSAVHYALNAGVGKQEAKAITKGCIEALYVKRMLEHQTARPFKIEVWTDSSSAKAVMQKAWTKAQNDTLGGADDVGSTVEQDRPHLAEQIEHAGECGRSAGKMFQEQYSTSWQE